MTAFHARVIEKLRALPGVQAAAGAAGMPFSDMQTSFLLSRDDTPLRERPKARVAVVSPGLFRLLDIGLLQGRDFSDGDRVGHPLVAMVNEAFARRYLADRIGGRLRVSFWNGQMKPWSEFKVVGVVEDTLNRALDRPREPALYLNALQVPLEGFIYFVRTLLSASALASGFQSAVWSIDPAVERVMPRALSVRIEESLGDRREALGTVGVFAGLGLSLAVAGLGASLSAGVSESFQEIGVRVH